MQWTGGDPDVYAGVEEQEEPRLGQRPVTGIIAASSTKKPDSPVQLDASDPSATVARSLPPILLERRSVKEIS